MYLDLTLETQLADAISPISESHMFEDVFNSFSVLLSHTILSPLSFNRASRICVTLLPNIQPKELDTYVIQRIEHTDQCGLV